MSVSLSPTPATTAPAPSPGVRKETEGSTQPDESRSQPLKPMNVTDAMAYIQNIREHRDPSVYDEFLKIMTEFKSQRYVH